MRTTLVILVAVIALAALPATAELQNVLTGGEIKIRGNYYSNAFTGPAAAEIRWPNIFLPARAMGGPFNALGAVSIFDWDDRGNELKMIEQRTRLNIRADFTNEVSAFIELDSYDIWGEDFRSNYITGADGRAASGNDVEIYQSYIQASEMWGYPLRLRIGRQELSLGNEWLVGTNSTNSFFTGLSFDAIRLTYATDTFSVDAFASKLADISPIEEDGDVDFYGIYGSYTGLEDITIDAYWLFLRDAASLNDTNFIWLPEWIEDILGIDDYDPTELHTIGLRGAGTYGAFDFEAEVAFQTGDAHSVGFTFKPFGVYGDDSADYSEWAGNLEVGYTFDMNYQPRVYLGVAYFGGEDDRDIDFFDWINPFDKPDASVSFNRLFSNVEYSKILDTNGSLSNFWVARGGVSAMPTENIEVMLDVAYFQALEEFQAPPSINIGRFRIPIAPALSFWTTSNDDELGWEVGLTAKYHYSEDLTFEAGWSHLFTDDGLDEGNFTQANGLVFDGGTSDDDADYVYFETKIAF
ncbi:MAG: alginate export family protein [Candidatus Hydrogenedentes bacterium]|nr:alginate export family protein [Candidatus Hydrogenedentota bacterium]